MRLFKRSNPETEFISGRDYRTVNRANDKTYHCKRVRGVLRLVYDHKGTEYSITVDGLPRKMFEEIPKPLKPVAVSTENDAFKEMGAVALWIIIFLVAFFGSTAKAETKIKTFQHEDKVKLVKGKELSHYESFYRLNKLVGEVISFNEDSDRVPECRIMYTVHFQVKPNLGVQESYCSYDLVKVGK